MLPPMPMTRYTHAPGTPLTEPDSSPVRPPRSPL